MHQATATLFPLFSFVCLFIIPSFPIDRLPALLCFRSRKKHDPSRFVWRRQPLPSPKLKWTRLLAHATKATAPEESPAYLTLARPHHFTSLHSQTPPPVTSRGRTDADGAHGAPELPPPRRPRSPSLSSGLGLGLGLGGAGALPARRRRPRRHSWRLPGLALV